MSEDVSSFEVRPRQGAFRMAGGSLLALALLTAVQLRRSMHKHTSVAADHMCGRTLLGHTWTVTQSRGRLETKRATIFHETGDGCGAAYLLAPLWSWA